jgi:4,5-dihydroxyphthalate decarboxylase
MTASRPVRLKTLLGEHAGTTALRKGELRSPAVELDIVDVKAASQAFKRVVQDLEFDLAELAIVTFLIAKAHGKPLVLLPAVVMGRFQHPYLVYDPARGPLAPRDLAGRRVGVRSYSVTTGAWVRGILADDHGVDLDRVTWVTMEDPHVAEFRDPPNVQRASAGKDLATMLREGELDAAILGEVPAADSPLKPLIPDPAAAARDWHRRHGAIQINHMVVVTEATSRAHPDAVRAAYRLLAEGKRRAPGPAPGEPDGTPFGFAANRRNLEVAIDCCHRQRLIPRRYAVDELFDDVTRALGQ